MVTKAKPLTEDEVFEVHDRLVRAAEAEGYKFFYIGKERGKPEAFRQGSPDGPRQTALIWAFLRVEPARMRMRRARMIEEAADREQAIRQAMLKNQCVPAAKGQKLDRCLGSRRRGTPPVSPYPCDVAQRTCSRAQPETEATWRVPAVRVTTNVEDLVPNHDDRLRDKASAKARSGLSDLLAAVACWAEHASQLESALPIIGHEFAQRRAANIFSWLVQVGEQALAEADLIRGFPDIRDRTDWELALSDIGIKLREAGCSGREVALWLRGDDDPDEIAALENKLSRRRKMAR